MKLLKKAIYFFLIVNLVNIYLKSVKDLNIAYFLGGFDLQVACRDPLRAACKQTCLVGKPQSYA